MPASRVPITLQAWLAPLHASPGSRPGIGAASIGARPEGRQRNATSVSAGQRRFPRELVNGFTKSPASATPRRTSKSEIVRSRPRTAPPRPPTTSPWPLAGRPEARDEVQPAVIRPATNRIVPQTFTCGGTPMRVAPNTHVGNVLTAPPTKFGDHEVVEREHEGQQEPGDDARQDQRQRHLDEGLERGGEQVLGRVLERPVEALHAGAHRDRHERDREPDVAEEDRSEPDRDLPEHEHGEQRTTPARSLGSRSRGRSRSS